MIVELEKQFSFRHVNDTIYEISGWAIRQRATIRT